jgi:hypothetical protein
MSLGCPVCHSLSLPADGSLWCDRADCPSKGAVVARFDPVVVITDHALLRYLERGMGIDVEAIRAGLGALCGRGAKAGARYVTHGGVRFVLHGYQVVTCLDKAWVSPLGRPRSGT